MSLDVKWPRSSTTAGRHLLSGPNLLAPRGTTFWLFSPLLVVALVGSSLELTPYPPVVLVLIVWLVVAIVRQRSIHRHSMRESLPSLPTVSTLLAPLIGMIAALTAYSTDMISGAVTSILSFFVFPVLVLVLVCTVSATYERRSHSPIIPLSLGLAEAIAGIVIISRF
jgi:hypothetical protein